MRDDDPLRLIWGKASGDDYHPLICHLLDIAATASILLEKYSSNRLTPLGKMLGFEGKTEWRPFVLFLIALHDIGKATPAFQMKVPKYSERLRETELCLPSVQSPAKHTILGHHILSRLLADFLESETARFFSLAVMGHHGEYPPFYKASSLLAPRQCFESWSKLHREIFNRLIKILEVTDFPQAPPGASGLIFLGGLCTIADWIGSSEEFFPYAHPDNLKGYYDAGQNRARHALRKLHLALPRQHRKNFLELFPGFRSLNPLQQAAIEAVEQAKSPFVLLIEAPMGEGKTEAALLAYARWHQKHQLRGFYFALPTQATGNMLFHRVESFLRRYADGETQFHLLHGTARFNDDYRRLRLRSIGDNTRSDTGTIYADSWFTPKKRALLAQYGVGTIDQILVGVLQSRHFFLRLYEVAGKVLIIDEVHAYDTYMSTLLENLLSWLRRLGTSVILLSATLPRHRHDTLLQAYLGASNDSDVAETSPGYPGLSLRDLSGSKVDIAPESTQSSTVIFHPLPTEDADFSTVVSLLQDRLREGGCVACILNTVQEAQRLYQILKKAFSRTEIHLFHARFTLRRRLEIEKRITERFGKNGKRPQRAIVVATQVLEQSLDVDFDLMISALAPIDLLLQRAGRLHRHRRERPEPLRQRELYLLVPPVLNETKESFGIDRYVYYPSILYRSAKLFYDGGHWRPRHIRIPDDLPTLIEKVYAQMQDAEETAIEKWIEEEEGQEYASLFMARQASIPFNEDDDPEILLDIAEITLDDPDAPGASTRLGPPTLTLIVTDSHDDLTLRTPQNIEACYYESLRIQSPWLIRHLREHIQRPKAWQKDSLLFDAIPFDPDWRIEEGGYLAYYSQELGMVIHKKEEE